MSAFDWHRFFLDDKSWAFLGEVALRVLIAWFVVFIFLKVSGRRGVRQLSLFELVVILTLGSASGDVTFYDDVPVLPVITVFVVIMILYRATTWLTSHSERISNWVQGNVVTLIEEGRYVLESLDGLNISEDEFFMELRVASVEHLGQVRLALIELDGQLSIYYYEPGDVKPGLSVLPAEHREDFITVPTDGLYACTHCGNTQHIAEGHATACLRCNASKWSLALRNHRTG